VKMDLSADVASGKLSPLIAALMEQASAKRWVITVPESGWTGYYTEEHAKRIIAKHPEYTLTPPEAA
jgi:hypothetical protein